MSARLWSELELSPQHLRPVQDGHNLFTDIKLSVDPAPRNCGLDMRTYLPL